MNEIICSNVILSGGTNTTQIATTAFVTSANSSKATKGFATAMAIALAPFKEF